MNSSSSTSLRLQHLDVSVGGRQILVDIHLEFEPGRTHVLVGPSGSGKTTLLRAINRLNELFGRYHTQGEVLVPWNGGERRVYADSYPLEQLRRRVGMVFQQPNPFPLSIADNIAVVSQVLKHP